MAGKKSKKIEGKIEQAEGSVRETVGKATGNKSTELKGKVQHAKGKVIDKLG